MRPSGAKWNVNIRRHVRCVGGIQHERCVEERRERRSVVRSALWQDENETQQQLARRTTERREFCVQSRVLTSESFEASAGWRLARAAALAACSTSSPHRTQVVECLPSIKAAACESNAWRVDSRMRSFFLLFFAQLLVLSALSFSQQQPTSQLLLLGSGHSAEVLSKRRARVRHEESCRIQAESKADADLARQQRVADPFPIQGKLRMDLSRSFPFLLRRGSLSPERRTGNRRRPVLRPRWSKRTQH